MNESRDPQAAAETDEHVHGENCDHDHHPQEPRRVVKIGRNEPCPCGSGRKYKQCCLGKTDVSL